MRTSNKLNAHVTQRRPIRAPTAPTIEPYLGSLSVKEGEQKIVKCEAKGSPKPNVTWYREGKQIDRTECGKYPKDCEGIAYEVYEEGAETSPQHTSWTTAVLKIRSALYPRDQGEFKCVASNGNPPSPEKTFTFDVQASSFPSHFVLKPKKRIRVQQGQEVKVECEAEGVEETKLQWKNQTVSGDIPVPDSMVTYVKDGSKNRVRAILKIPNAQKNIQGWYKCVLLFYGKTDHRLIQVKVYQ